MRTQARKLLAFHVREAECESHCCIAHPLGARGWLCSAFPVGRRVAKRLARVVHEVRLRARRIHLGCGNLQVGSSADRACTSASPVGAYFSDRFTRRLSGFGRRYVNQMATTDNSMIASIR